LKINLIFIKANYEKLSKYIIILETSGLPMLEAIDIIVKVGNEIGVDNSSVGKIIKQKLNTNIEHIWDLK